MAKKASQQVSQSIPADDAGADEELRQRIGTGAMKNSLIIKRFPEGVESLHPEERAPRLKNVLAEIPAFRGKALDDPGRKKWTIISTELDGCEGCTIQVQGLQESLPRLTHQQSVEIFEIHVSHPWVQAPAERRVSESMTTSAITV